MTSRSAGSFSVTTNRWMIVFIGILLVFILAFVGFGFYVNEKYHRLASPLSSSLREIRLETTEAHHLVERILDGDTLRDVSSVWFELDQALDRFRQNLEKQEHAIEVLFSLGPALSLLEQNKRLVEEIDAYKLSVGRQMNNGAAVDHDYEHKHMAVLTRLDDMQMVIQQVRRRDLQRFRLIMGGGVGVCILLAFLIAVTIRRYEKQTAAHYEALNQAHDELKTKIEAQALAEEALRQTNTLFRTAFETSPDAVVITRVEDGIIIDVNSGFTKYTGYDRGEVIGRSVIDLDFWTDLNKRNIYLNEVLEKGSAENWEAVFRTKTGRLLTCLLSSKKIDINGEPHLLSDVRDITDRKLYEKRVQAANTFLSITNRHSIMWPLLKEFISEIKKLANCSAAAVRIMDEEGMIPYAEAEGFNDDFCSLEGNLSIHSDGGMCGRVIQNKPGALAPFFTQNGSYFVTSTSALLATATEEQKSILRNTCHRFGYESLALIPIRSGNATLGLIHIADEKPDAITANVVEILESAALQLGIAIQRVCAEQALKVAYRELEDRVRQRTEMLTLANEQMLREIEERKYAEQALIDHQERLRYLSTELLQTGERERRRIATEIHDRIGQTLAVTKIQLGALKAALEPDDKVELVDDIRQLITRTIKDTRTLTFELSPPVLYELGLQAALEWLAGSIRQHTGLIVIVERDGPVPELKLGRRVFLYQAVRELTFNVIKHSGAEKAVIKISGSPSAVNVQVIDNGRWNDPSNKTTEENQPELGFGLFSIREQIQYYGGHIEVIPLPDRGTQASITMPIDT
jgi:PAS domain S-box-containing protein